MIYTLTLNPSVDCTNRLSELKLGQIHRSDDQHLSAAGKGVNVSKMLKNLGVQSTAAGFVSGFTGDCMLAAFICGFISSGNAEKFSVAAGSGRRLCVGKRNYKPQSTASYHYTSLKIRALKHCFRTSLSKMGCQNQYKYV